MLDRIYVVNLSSSISEQDVRTMCWASTSQIAIDFAPAWGLAPIVVEARDKDSDPPTGPGYCTIVLVDKLDDPDALGWHSEAGGQIIGRIGVSPVLLAGGDVLNSPLSVSSVLSHEVLETIADQFINAWGDGPGEIEYAWEVCDPVESSGYPITVQNVGSAWVSNFVLPAWFDPQSTEGPYDKMNTAPGPFQLAPGGYAVTRQFGIVKEIYASGKRKRGFGFRSAKRKARA